MTTLSREDPTHPMAPMSVCTAMSQGYIGYDLQNALREELLDRGLPNSVAPHADPGGGKPGQIRPSNIPPSPSAHL